MANIQHEDAILKMGMEYFRDSLLKSLEINYTYVDPDPTELVSLTVEKMYQDFTFLTTEGFYIHIEFQSTSDGTLDLRRFHAYEAVMSHKTGKNVRTYVANKATAILYTFADKFLGANDLKDVKEAVYMTRLGQMILDDGIKMGLEQGLEQGLERGTKNTRILFSLLFQNNRMDDLKKATEDEEYCQQLKEEFHIEDNE